MIYFRKSASEEVNPHNISKPTPLSHALERRRAVAAELEVRRRGRVDHGGEHERNRLQQDRCAVTGGLRGLRLVLVLRESLAGAMDVPGPNSAEERQRCS